MKNQFSSKSLALYMFAFINGQKVPLSPNMKDKIEQSIKSSSTNPSNYKQFQCPVCLTNQDKFEALRCAHVFCEDCFSQLSRNESQITCPLCRVVSDFSIEYDENSPSVPATPISTRSRSRSRSPVRTFVTQEISGTSSRGNSSYRMIRTRVRRRSLQRRPATRVLFEPLHRNELPDPVNQQQLLNMQAFTNLNQALGMSIIDNLQHLQGINNFSFTASRNFSNRLFDVTFSSTTPECTFSFTSSFVDEHEDETDSLSLSSEDSH